MKPVSVGDVVVASFATLARIGLVIRVYDTHLNLLLCHSFPELATDLDLIVTPCQVTPYPLVVQPDLYFPVLHSQVRPVGRLDEERTRAVARSLLTDGESVASFDTGTPLAGPTDARWQFKHEELADVVALRDEAMRLLDAGV